MEREDDKLGPAVPDLLSHLSPQPIWTVWCQHNKMTTCQPPPSKLLLSLTQSGVLRAGWVRGGNITTHFLLSFYMLILMESNRKVFKHRTCLLSQVRCSFQHWCQVGLTQSIISRLWLGRSSWYWWSVVRGHIWSLGCSELRSNKMHFEINLKSVPDLRCHQILYFYFMNLIDVQNKITAKTGR